MNLSRALFGKEPAPITAKNRKAVRFVAECIAFHFRGSTENWRDYTHEAQMAIVGYVACKILDQDSLYTKQLIDSYE